MRKYTKLRISNWILLAIAIYHIIRRYKHLSPKNTPLTFHVLKYVTFPSCTADINDVKHFFHR